MAKDTVFDLAVIGGGINGCGIARDAQGRGLKVLLAEQADLASATSSASTKLIHGGLRYLEHYEFRLVREALIEREVLLRAAPHIIWPLRFVLPHHKGLRPWPIIRLGLFLYDHLGGRKILPGTRSLNLNRNVAGEPLKADYQKGFEYSDCWVEDTRLVVLNARDAADLGAEILTRTKVTSARRENGLWTITLSNKRIVKAKALVNAAGPWVSQVISGVAGLNTPDRIRMVKGSHIVVDKLYDHDRCYIFQNADGRICFAIPYETDFTLIGTTDEDFNGNPADAAISEAETNYLLKAVNEYFRKPVTKKQIRWSYAGVRPLYDDGATKAQEATRDYVLKLNKTGNEAPLLSVFGGKITTYRRLAEHALEQLAPFFPGTKPAWTANASLPGGDFPHDGADALTAEIVAEYPFLKKNEALRFVRAYGTRSRDILGQARKSADLGLRFGAYLTEAEIKYLIKNEWVKNAEDVVWRRSKLGLRMTPAQISALEAYITGKSAAKKPASKRAKPK